MARGAREGERGRPGTSWLTNQVHRNATQLAQTDHSSHPLPLTRAPSNPSPSPLPLPSQRPFHSPFFISRNRLANQPVTNTTTESHLPPSPPPLPRPSPGQALVAVAAPQPRPHARLGTTPPFSAKPPCTTTPTPTPTPPHPLPLPPPPCSEGSEKQLV